MTLTLFLNEETTIVLYATIFELEVVKHIPYSMKSSAKYHFFHYKCHHVVKHVPYSMKISVRFLFFSITNDIRYKFSPSDENKAYDCRPNYRSIMAILLYKKKVFLLLITLSISPPLNG